VEEEEEEEKEQGERRVEYFIPCENLRFTSRTHGSVSAVLGSRFYTRCERSFKLFALAKGDVIHERRR